MTKNISLTQLNLPPVSLRIANDTIYDPLRQKYVALTPEEHVRQHFTAFLIEYLGYRSSQMGNEVSLNLYNTRRRCDTVVFDREGKPWMIVEYKAPSVPLTQAVFEQIARYNFVLGAQYIVVSNGLNHYCARYKDGRYVYMSGLPEYPA